MSDYEQVSGTTVSFDPAGFEYEQQSGTTVNIELRLQKLNAFVQIDGTAREITAAFIRDNGEAKELLEAFVQIDDSKRQI